MDVCLILNFLRILHIFKIWASKFQPIVKILWNLLKSVETLYQNVQILVKIWRPFHCQSPCTSLSKIRWTILRISGIWSDSNLRNLLVIDLFLFSTFLLVSPLVSTISLGIPVLTLFWVLKPLLHSQVDFKLLYCLINFGLEDTSSYILFNLSVTWLI